MKISLEKCTSTQIPVFNGNNRDIVEDNFWRPRIEENNYVAQRKMDTYRPISLSALSGDFPHYPSMPLLCNSRLVVFSICQKTRMVHKKLEYIVELHKMILADKMGAPIDSPRIAERYVSEPSKLYEYKITAEEMIYCMRRVLDSLVQLTFLLTNYKEFIQTKSIIIDSLGKVFAHEKQYPDLARVILGDKSGEYPGDKTGFCRTINDLFNSFKHCLMHDESNSLVGAEYPTILSYYAKDNKHQKVVYHNHNAYHLMMGFQDTILRILDNQKKCQILAK